MGDDTSKNKKNKNNWDAFYKKINSVIEIQSQDVASIKETYKKVYKEGHYLYDTIGDWAWKFYEMLKKHNKLSYRFNEEHINRVKGVVSELGDKDKYEYMKKYEEDFMNYILDISFDEKYKNNEFIILHDNKNVKKKLGLRNFNFYDIKNSLTNLDHINETKHYENLKINYEISDKDTFDVFLKQIDLNEIKISFLKRILFINNYNKGINPIYYITITKNMIENSDDGYLKTIIELMELKNVDNVGELKQTLMKTKIFYLLLLVLKEEGFEELLDNLRQVFIGEFELEKEVFETIFLNEDTNSAWPASDSKYLTNGLFSDFLLPIHEKKYLKDSIERKNDFIVKFLKKTKDYYDYTMFKYVIKHFSESKVIYKEYIILHFQKIFKKSKNENWISGLPIKQIIEIIDVIVKNLKKFLENKSVNKDDVNAILKKLLVELWGNSKAKLEMFVMVFEGSYFNTKKKYWRETANIIKKINEKNEEINLPKWIKIGKNTKLNLARAIFRTVGTNFDSYVKRFTNIYTNTNNNYFTLNAKIKNYIKIIQNDNIIDSFTSEVTCRQFLEVMESLGFISKEEKKYKIIRKTIDYDITTKIIFTHDENPKINILRQSRLISFLYHINYINEENIKRFSLSGVKNGSPKIQNIKEEISEWERFIATSDFDKISKILHKISNWSWEKKPIQKNNV